MAEVGWALIASVCTAVADSGNWTSSVFQHIFICLFLCFTDLKWKFKGLLTDKQIRYKVVGGGGNTESEGTFALGHTKLSIGPYLRSILLET